MRDAWADGTKMNVFVTHDCKQSIHGSRGRLGKNLDKSVTCYLDEKRPLVVEGCSKDTRGWIWSWTNSALGECQELDLAEILNLHVVFWSHDHPTSVSQPALQDTVMPRTFLAGELLEHLRHIDVDGHGY